MNTRYAKHLVIKLVKFTLLMYVTIAIVLLARLVQRYGKRGDFLGFCVTNKRRLVVVRVRFIFEITLAIVHTTPIL